MINHGMRSHMKVVRDPATDAHEEGVKISHGLYVTFDIWDTREAVDTRKYTVSFTR